MPGRGSYYQNSDITDAKLSNVRLPEKIQCSTCNKWKGPTNFAKKRLNELRRKVYENKNDRTTQCTLCTPKQVMELKCYQCGKDKGLEDFAKAQRKDPDHAKCLFCMNDQVRLEAVENKGTFHAEVAGNSDSDDDNDSDEDYDDDNDGFGTLHTSTYAESSAGTPTGNLIGSFDELSVSDSVSTTTGGFSSLTPNRFTAGGNGAAASKTTSWAQPLSYASSISSSATTTKGSSSVFGCTFNSKAYGHPGAPSVADSMATNRPASSTGSKWAKVKAYKPEPATAKEDEEDNDEDAWAGEAEDESSSDDESDDEFKMTSGSRR